MDNFVGNNAKFIIQWGQLITLGIILVAIFLVYRIVKGNKYFLPRGFFAYAGTIILTILIVVSGLAFVKVTRMKPRISFVINGLEVLRNKPAPSFDFYLLADDSRKNLSDFRGKTVLLNYWATWCRPPSATSTSWPMPACSRNLSSPMRYSAISRWSASSWC